MILRKANFEKKQARFSRFKENKLILMRVVALTGFVMVVLLAARVTGEELSWSIDSSSEWKQDTVTASGVGIRDDRLVLGESSKGTWKSRWHDWPNVVEAAHISVEAAIDLFDNKTIEVIVDGSKTPFVDQGNVPHDWYGRCMIAIIDEKRWIMALRSGVDHVQWGDRDAIHLITSSDEGRSWSKLNRWFDGSPIEGIPYEDGRTHSEPGLYKMPNRDLILQFWRASKSSGTTQLRSRDNGKTWALDANPIKLEGVVGVDGSQALGTEDYFVDPDNPSDVYMAFQYLRAEGKFAGTLLAKSKDNGKNYTFLSWIGPLSNMDDPEAGATFEPAIEYVGNRTIVAVLRAYPGNGHTWQSVSTDMGASFSPLVEIASQINGGVPQGLWQRARLYKESNPYFQHNNRLNYSKGEGRLWGVGLHQNGNSPLWRKGSPYTRKPVVYWSDNNGRSWYGPVLLHGSMYPGTDTGYGDLKRRVDNTFVAATYFANRVSTRADTEQYTFGGNRISLLVEIDRDGDGLPDADSGWREVYNGQNTLSVTSLAAKRWRLSLLLNSTDTAVTPEVGRVMVKPQ